MNERFDDFIRERRYLKGISPATVEWYKDAFDAWKRYSGGDPKQFVISMRQAGMQAVSCNSWICAMNAYWKWAGENTKLGKLKEEQKILATFNAQQIHRLIHWKPIKRNETRAHAIALVALDTGLRISELLGLARKDVDFDNLVLLVHGKGNKQRLVPMSIELRKVLYRHLAKHQHARVFCTKTGSPLSVRNSERDFKVVCRKVGIAGVRTSWHTLRHTFAVNYLRAGGNLYYLQRILGHSSITTTERYLRSLGIEDLQRVHDGLSLLAHG